MTQDLPEEIVGVETDPEGRDNLANSPARGKRPAGLGPVSYAVAEERGGLDG